MKKANGEGRRAIVYCRVSTMEQTNPEFCSLDVQAERCRSWAQGKGWEVVDVLADTSTGANVDRPKLQELRERAARHEFDVVVAFKLDRLSRRVLDFWTLVTELERHGVEVATVQDSFDGSTPVGKLMMNILAGFAEFEREQIVARAKAGMTGRARAGWWPTRWQPPGYDRVSSGQGCPITLKPNDDAKWVKEAFGRFADGHGPTAIADWLNAEGLRAHGGRKWSRRMVRDMMANPIYIGHVRWEDEEYEGKHPAIVAGELWEAAQRRLARGKRGQYLKPINLEKGGYCPALLGRVVGTDGTPLKRYWAGGRNGRPVYYYVEPATDVRFNAEAFDKELLRVVREVVTGDIDVGGTLDAFRKTHDEALGQIQEREQRLRTDLSRLDTQEKRLVEAIAAGVALDRVREKLEEIKVERARLEGELGQCNLARADVKRESQHLQVFAELREFFGAVRRGSDFVDPRNVLRAVVHRVQVDMAAQRVALTFEMQDTATASNPARPESASQVDTPAPVGVADTQDVGGNWPLVSSGTVGVGEGIRTLGLQSHSLTL